MSSEARSRPAREFNVLVAGGGVAGLEALLALHAIDDHRLRLTLVSPQDDFVVRAHRVREPFTPDPAPRVPLAELTSEVGAAHVRASVRHVRPGQRRVELDTGEELSYDALLLAPGARPRPSLPGAVNFDGTRLAAGEVGAALHRVEAGELGSLAFVVPPRTAWTLPAYELALMSAQTLRGRTGERTPRLLLVSPEQSPLQLFGSVASAAVTELLSAAGVEFIGESYAMRRTPRGVRVAPGRHEIAADAVVALPDLEGPHLDGVPRDTRGFMPVDACGRVGGLDAVYGAGDGTDFPIKQGGLAAQQADAVAQQIAARAGLPVTPAPFRPVLRGRLLTGRGSRFLRSTVAGGGGEGAAVTGALWWPPAKVSGRLLGPWLAAHGAVDWSPDATAGIDVERALTMRDLAVTVDLEPHDRASLTAHA